MIILKIVIIALSLAFLTFGYFIFFQKKYNLINGFESDIKAERKDERYARRVGMIEFILGISLLLIGILLILFT